MSAEVCHSGQQACGRTSLHRRRSLTHVSSSWEGWDGSDFTSSPNNTSSSSNSNSSTSLQWAALLDGDAAARDARGTSSHEGVLQLQPTPRKAPGAIPARAPAVWVPVQFPAEQAALRA